MIIAMKHPTVKYGDYQQLSFFHKDNPVDSVSFFVEKKEDFWDTVNQPHFGRWNTICFLIKTLF